MQDAKNAKYFIRENGPIYLKQMLIGANQKMATPDATLIIVAQVFESMNTLCSLRLRAFALKIILFCHELQTFLKFSKMKPLMQGRTRVWRKRKTFNPPPPYAGMT